MFNIQGQFFIQRAKTKISNQKVKWKKIYI